MNGPSIDDSSSNLANRVAALPLSDFEKQIVLDHPEHSVAECKIVANMLLKCVEFANRLGDKSSKTFPCHQPNLALGKSVAFLKLPLGPVLE